MIRKELFDEFFKKHPEDKSLVQFINFPNPENAELSLILQKLLLERGYHFDPALSGLFTDYVTECRADKIRFQNENGWLVERDCIPAIEKTQDARYDQSGGDITEIIETDIPIRDRPRTVAEILAELNDMVGMTEVKKTIEEIAHKTRYSKKLAEKRGKAFKGEGNHIVITGNPGTGKTTIVRTLAALFKAIGVLPSDIPLEIQGGDLKAAYVGQSKDKVNQFCDDAVGRILFIDEAYTLVNEQGPVDEFANEAIGVLMARLENDRDKFIGVVAGYPREMETFIKKGNPGMERRFKHRIFLPDYSADELIEIFERFNVQKEGYTLTDEARKKAREAIRDMVAGKDERFGNAGTIRIFFERTTSRLSLRLSKLPEDEQESLGMTIQAEDIAWDKKAAAPIDEILADLDKMVGMTEVKKIVRELAENLKIQQERIDLEKEEAAARGEEYKPKAAAAERNNFVITGNPGTGKTTIVRTFAKLFHSLGLTSKDTPVECQGNDLKGSYVGQSKDKVNGYCDRAMGGLLFVDEAYSLVDEKGPVDDFATEAITVLMARMENDGGKFITVAAGYEKEMGLFLDKSNPGMRSRFVHFINLPDYSADELITIFEEFNVKSAGFTLSDEAREEAKKLIRNMVSGKAENFGNAREMRELFNRIKRRQASRLNKLSPEERKTKMNLIDVADIRGPEDRKLTLDEILAELDTMTGMTDVKKAVRTMAQKIGTQKEREEKARAEAVAKGEKWEPKADQKQGNHIVLTGNPGTGKTTVVRMLAKLFKAIGALPTDKLVEINGNDLSGGYMGQTKDKVNEYCRQAMGGVLFIDEAYVLANEQGPVDSYAKQAAETLMTHLENEKDKFICIVAGYENQMGLFLDKLNPGMRSRFNHYLHIADYNAAELLEIFEKGFVKKSGMTLTAEALDTAKKAIEAMLRKKRPDFGNAREIRRLFEEITGRQSERVSALPEEQRTLQALNTIEATDVGEAIKPVSIDSVLAELDAMVGMKEVKDTIRGIAVKLEYQKKIQEQTGKAPDSEGNHIVITGNPGTGKTTIVRTLCKLFKAIGLLAGDKPVEIQGNDLKGSYVGQSKDKVNEYCRQSLGCVLFIDEAYALVNAQGAVDQFAQEAIDVLMAHLENDRDKFVGIVAGYPREMDTFIKKSNPGMERRFKHYITLPDYSADELIEIFERFNVKKAGYTLSDAAREKAREAIRFMVDNKSPTFGNAGAIRTFFEKVTGNTANRVSKLPDEKQLEVLQVIEPEDIPGAPPAPAPKPPAQPPAAKPPLPKIPVTPAGPPDAPGSKPAKRPAFMGPEHEKEGE
jgi:SpoVK/Ycf46/Vps4 family AAA+-type ATPase